jgi:hypothetical protein
VCRGIVTVDAAAEHRDGDASGLERAAMRFTVDPAREPADDDETGGGELAPKPARDLGAVGRARAGADDRDRRTREDLALGAAADKQAWRWVVDRPQERRKPETFDDADVAQRSSSRGER